MVKYLAILILFASCALYGFQSAKALERRAAMHKKLCSAIRTISNVVLTTRQPLFSIMQKYPEIPFRRLILACFEGLPGGEDAAAVFERAEREQGAELGGAIDAETRQVLTEFLLALRQLDGSRLSEAMKRAETDMEKIAERTESDSRQRGRIYRTVGVLLGAAVAILLI
ncbi:MAG: stage III sporulation protein AB [Clostridia bacterium]|nr:stage III sporulation protein AB [Clostridia bacterium]